MKKYYRVLGIALMSLAYQDLGAMLPELTDQKTIDALSPGSRSVRPLVQEGVDENVPPAQVSPSKQEQRSTFKNDTTVEGRHATARQLLSDLPPMAPQAAISMRSADSRAPAGTGIPADRDALSFASSQVSGLTGISGVSAVEFLALKQDSVGLIRKIKELEQQLQKTGTDLANTKMLFKGACTKLNEGKKEPVVAFNPELSCQESGKLVLLALMRERAQLQRTVAALEARGTQADQAQTAEFAQKAALEQLQAQIAEQARLREEEARLREIEQQKRAAAEAHIQSVFRELNASNTESVATEAGQVGLVEEDPATRFRKSFKAAQRALKMKLFQKHEEAEARKISALTAQHQKHVEEIKELQARAEEKRTADLKAQYEESERQKLAALEEQHKQHLAELRAQALKHNQQAAAWESQRRAEIFESTARTLEALMRQLKDIKQVPAVLGILEVKARKLIEEADQEKKRLEKMQEGAARPAGAPGGDDV